jgi:hypothetical protein
MVRRVVAALVVMAFSVGILSAAEMFGIVTKVDGNKITFTEFKKGEGKKFEKGEPKTYTVAKDAKIQEMKGFGPDAEFTALKDGLKSKQLTTEMPEKGRFARVVTNDKNEVTELSVSLFKGFGGKKKKDDGQ